MSVLQEEKQGHGRQVCWLPMDSIFPNPGQPRKEFNDFALMELASSIRQFGLLQPITVQKKKAGYEIVMGERRYRACQLLGFSHIDAFVMPATDGESALLALIENLQRENLHFFEEAEGYQSLLREHGLTQEELARRLSKNQSTIANKLRILKLSRVVKEKILTAGLSERHARALLRLHNERAQLALIEKILQEGLSVKATEELVEKELKQLYGEEKNRQAASFRLRCSNTLYLNTLRRTLDKIELLGVRTELNYTDLGDKLEVVIQIHK